MKRCRAVHAHALMLAISMTLTACAGAPETGGPQLRTAIVLRVVPEAAKVPCDEPVKLTGGSRKELKTALAQDGVALLECETRRRAAVEGTEE